MKTSWYQFILQHTDFITMSDAESWYWGLLHFGKDLVTQKTL